MRTVGVDLAAGAPGTALAEIIWSGGAARLERLEIGMTDADIVASVASGEVWLGVDCPLGWPDAFVDFVGAHHAATDPLLGPVEGHADWRRPLVYRHTDHVVRERIGRWPLSVSTDRLGVTALRGAGLLRRLAAAGFPVDRAAEGRLFEVYPGGSLRLWGLDTTGYRVDAARRAVLLDALTARAPWLDMGPFAPLAVAKADAFDAVIAALATRAGALGLFEPPAPGVLDVVRREGWVVLPDSPLEGLIAGA
ncbi:branched-chain amino acid aminotransferase [Microbacterium sp. SUBG005]|nr:branched-chain amino acid aminotransferase [Microbacterium sp. SUBG005]